MIALDINTVYTVELCSGELRQWKYLGQDSRRLVWWMDQETRQEFNESTLMYAWSVKRESSDQNAPGKPVDRTGRCGK